MKEYHFERLNNNVRALGIILAMPFFLGGLAAAHLWNHDSLYGKWGLALAVLSLLGIIVCYFNIYKNYILKIDDNTLVISNRNRTKEKKYNINDIALIQYNKSVNAVDVFISKTPVNETILIFSNTGKGIFVCANGNNPEFNQFFSDIRNRINAKEKLIYGKQIKMTQMYRSLYINPLYENSRVVKKKTRESGFYFGLKILLLIIIPFMIIINLWSIFPYLPKTFKYEGISFQHERNWETKTDKKSYYYISCEDKSSPNVIIITFNKNTYEESSQEYIENYLKDIENTKPESEIKTIKTGKFGDYDCILANYSYRAEETNYYAVIYAFNTNGRSISIVKQSGRKAGLERDFMLIEKSFKVK